MFIYSLRISLLAALWVGHPSIVSAQTSGAADTSSPAAVSGDAPKVDEKQAEEWWKKTGHPKGKWWLTYEGYEGDAADKIWENVDIPPSPLLSPEEALESMQLDDRFRIELVAAEPLVVRPVFMRFDERGRLWVVEMPGYMRDIDGTGQDDPSGRIVVLEDDDGDGRMDRSTTFLDGLVMPRSLALVPEGALVVEPPRIWLARDLDGDLIADERTLLAEDYGVEGNPEHSANGLVRGLDNWLYSAKSAVRYQYRDGALTAEPTAFRGQWGISQDDTGRLFYNYNASPLHADLAPGQYFLDATGPNLSQRRHVRGPALLNVDLVADKALHPPRVTPLVTLGASDLRPDGTLKQFTAASSPFIYRGDLFPSAVNGDVFICDPVGNLVSHLSMHSDGLNLRAERTQPDREFLASTDERFRPVFLESGPDGALYVADMYTGIVEHKRYVTEYLRKQVLGRDLGQFTATGRIYRIVPKQSSTVLQESELPESAAGWVAQLDDRSGWMRDTAQRVLVQGDHREVASDLIRLATNANATPLGRLHALWTLEGLDALKPKVVRRALQDTDARLREAAVRLTERLPAAARSEIASTLMSLANDSSLQVRLQLLLTLGASGSPEAWPVMRELVAADDAAPEFGVAAAAGLRGQELAFLAAAKSSLTGRALRPAEVHLWEQLGYDVMVRSDAAEVAALLNQLQMWPVGSPVGTALWAGASAHQRNGAPLSLAGPPTIYAESQAWPEGELATAAVKVFEQLTWPGDARFADAEVRPLTEAEQVLFERGKQTYATICAACHQVDGMGMAGVAPPLAGSPWVVENPRLPVEIVLRGLSGPVEVQGRTWDMVMPALGSVPGMFDDEGIAAITTYLRRAWGNQASPITVEDAARMRKLGEGRIKPWSAAELQALPEFETAKGTR